jgi:hypothetical protein
MALIDKVLAGYTATLWMQEDATPTPLTVAQLSAWASTEVIIGTTAGGTGTGGLQVPVENIPAFGSDDAMASYSIAGQRTGAKITTQNQVTSMTVVCPWNPADPAQLLIRDDGYNGSIIRTFVVAVYDGVDTVAYAFNAMVGGMQWDMATNAEGKFTFTIHPIGSNYYGWSTNT